MYVLRQQPVAVSHSKRVDKHITGLVTPANFPQCIDQPKPANQKSRLRSAKIVGSDISHNVVAAPKFIADCFDGRHEPWIVGRYQSELGQQQLRIASTGTIVQVAQNGLLPALMYAQKISRKAVAVGFEWETLDDVWEKVHEEIDELKATEPGSAEAVDEIGDVLFTVVNLARKQGIDAEMALRQTCEKFRTRWADMEASAVEMGRHISELSLDEMESLWQQAKEREEPR